MKWASGKIKISFRWPLVGWKFACLSIFRKSYRRPPPDRPRGSNRFYFLRKRSSPQMTSSLSSALAAARPRLLQQRTQGQSRAAGVGAGAEHRLVEPPRLTVVPGCRSSFGAPSACPAPRSARYATRWAVSSPRRTSLYAPPSLYAGASPRGPLREVSRWSLRSRHLHLPQHRAPGLYHALPTVLKPE